MACNCENIECLIVKFNPCSEGAELPLIATENGTWTAEIEFNGMWSEFGFGVLNGQRIVIPSIYLNEYYTHQIRILDSSGLLINETCYALKARAIASGDIYPVIPPGLSSFDITIAEAGNSITNDLLEGVDLAFIVTDGQSYNTAFWGKPVESDTLTSDILTFYIGQIVTFVTR